ncbi:MAG: AAA family ATPase [Candidatus Paceibacterota bacterium]|nr:MAG: AAA family ATPase [Candidatus Paceibacterota bacterium]
MRLKSIELSGFKSFAKKSQLEFGSPVTAIVGPNGSGKSNITESFRFVLGEQSMKSLRSKKGEDLIWNGSQELPRGNKASAKIILDNRKRLMNIDFDEVVVERVVFRDGVNQYFLNDSQVRLKDILEVLAPTNIGPSGHHIISQGEADKILNTNSRERREMIEDALGLRLYQYRKQESRRKLEKTEENLKQVELLRKEISPHIKFLRRQYEKLQKTKELRNDLLQKYLEFFSLESVYLAQKKKEVENLKEKPEERLISLRLELQKVASSLKNFSQDEKSEKLLQLESELRRFRQEKEELSRKLGMIEGQEISLRRILDSQKTSGDNLPIAIDRAKIEVLREELKEHWEVVENSSDLGLIKSLFKKIFESISNILTKENYVGDTASEHLELIKKLENERGELEEKQQKTGIEEKELTESFKSLQSEIEKEKDVNRDLEKNIFRLRAEESEILAGIAHFNDVLRNINSAEEDFERELKEARVLSGESVMAYEKFSVNLTPDYESVLRPSLKKEIEKMKIRLEDAGGIGEEVEREYREIAERDAFLEKELFDLQKSSESLKQLIKDLESQLDQNFKVGIENINKHFQELFSSMFSGGTARLSVVKDEKKRKRLDEDLQLDQIESEIPSLGDEEEEIEEGLDIKVNLPRKKIRGLEMLSGGERALTSIALIFALSQVNPPPFLVLDETDAALDEANSKRYGDMIESLSKHSQLILVTHNRETMSRAGVIYGVTMGKDGYSKVLSVVFDEAVAVAK